MGTSNIGRELDMCGQTALMGTSNIGRAILCIYFQGMILIKWNTQ
jgi:hypothetical protein